MKKICDFTIPRGNTSRYVYLFQLRGNFYKVTKKVLYANRPSYTIISVVNVPVKDVGTYINTVVALTY